MRVLKRLGIDFADVGLLAGLSLIGYAVWSLCGPHVLALVAGLALVAVVLVRR